MSVTNRFYKSGRSRVLMSKGDNSLHSLQRLMSLSFMRVIQIGRTFLKKHWNFCYKPHLSGLLKMMQKVWVPNQTEILISSSLYLTVDGNFTEWGVWGQCSSSCGPGTQVRTRTCTSPPPINNGSDCMGPKFETQPCNDFPCPSNYFSFINFKHIICVGFWNLWLRIKHE